MKTVVCVMLANGRPNMVRRAVASFHAQDYPSKRLLIWNTGKRGDYLEEYEKKSGEVVVAHDGQTASIGRLRNIANTAAVAIFGEELVELYAHFDSDDMSHPKRLSEQIDMLERSRADLVGYRECLFWDSTRATGEAWIYRNPNPTMAIGSSFLYRRETWEKRPFPDRNIGEDTFWLLNGRFKVHSVPSTWQPTGLPSEPRMICSIHSSNTSSKIVPGAAEWKRAPQFDEYCRVKMTL